METQLVIIFILLPLGAIGAWAGWVLGTKLYYNRAYRRPHYAFRRRMMRIWRLAFAIAFAFVGVVLGIVLLTYLGA